MNFKGILVAERLMNLSVLTNNQHGFRTGLENYCECGWGEAGFCKVRKADMDIPTGMELFKTNREEFFEEVHKKMESE